MITIQYPLENGQYVLKDMVSKKQEKHGCLRTVFCNGNLYNTTTLAEIRKVAEL